MIIFYSDAKENNRETNPTGSISEQESVNDGTNPSHAGSQKFRRREYSHHHPPQHQQSRSNNASGQSNEKRNKHEQRRKRPHSGEERDDRNRKNYKVNRTFQKENKKKATYRLFRSSVFSDPARTISWKFSRQF